MTINDVRHLNMGITKLIRTLQILDGVKIKTWGFHSTLFVQQKPIQSIQLHIRFPLESYFFMDFKS